MKQITYLLCCLFLSACVGGEVTQIQLPDTPKFVTSKQSFRYYVAHPAGENFELLQTSSGERFVMTYVKNSATLVVLTPVPMNLEFGMMLDENLCSNGLAAHRQMNWPEARYSINLQPSSTSNVKKDVPVGVCFSTKN